MAPTSRRQFLARAAGGAVGLLAPGLRARAGESPGGLLGPRLKEGTVGDLLHPPSDPAQWPAWREQLQAWRSAIRLKLRYSDALYRRPEFAWAASNFVCGFVMLCDETFYDWRRGRFTVDAFLDEGEREFGGYDSLVLWHAYPRLGFDPRNQFDFYRDQPGGLAGLRELARRCHRRGVRVFVDYNPWDTGTRREGKPDIEALAELVAAIEADGIFLDTLSQGAAELRARLDAARPGVVLESELALPLERLHDHHASWAQGFRDSAAPGVLRNKWVERRHLQHQIRRWDRDHSGELHCAWMNGSGILVWENVFGSWVGWSPRDRALLRVMAPMQRRFARLWEEGEWTPLVPTLMPEVFASLWQGRGLRLWTVVNRARRALAGPLLRLEARPGEQLFDLVTGRPLRPELLAGQWQIAGKLPARGLGAFLAAAPEALEPDFADFLKGQAQRTARASFEEALPARTVALRPVAASPRHAEVPAGMVRIPAARLTLQVEFRVRECGFYDSVPDSGPDWGPLHRPRLFTREVSLKAYAFDLTPVTNAQFAAFLKASGYRPEPPENFLKHWSGGAPPPGLEEHPVVYVSLDDARAYAAWAGKRLPTEEEWQFAAVGPDQHLYPWGNEMRPGLCNDGATGGTTAVTAFPAGRSPFGCWDLCGNVWHWTESERRDGRTRFCILKGGSWFKARGSDWYADGGPQPCRFAAKFLLMWPGLDRCATIGFRCAADLAA